MPRRSAVDLAHIAFRVAVCIADSASARLAKDAHVHPCGSRQRRAWAPCPSPGGPGVEDHEVLAAAGPVVVERCARVVLVFLLGRVGGGLVARGGG
ncbi:hypothetical protein PAPYR_11172 [Paratrimastix pyriformis]|uniref:Secreted protein n=1 Tax=Paratrimastix pyriformis TaxID=342808 RepID=A0ABQ8U669_9EUKA|nr:hypothetical protein PAPYR_11172 [Paratrimastix pyriformis]